MFETIFESLVTTMAPDRLLFLGLGVAVGLILGVIPGIGGLTGIALLLPLTFDMDKFSAIAMLVGLGAVGITSDTLTSILFAVPGTVGSQATILDGHPLARKGEAGRALGAAYASSLAGGIVGAILLAVLIPILKPVILLVGPPEVFMIGLLALTMVATLSGTQLVKGLIVACLGLLIGLIGQDPQLAVGRWTFDSLYLMDGINVIVVSLGLFGIPELIDMAIEGRAIADVPRGRIRGMAEGVRDFFRNWWLALRCSVLGVWVGILPGLGMVVVDWIAYGHARQTVKGASETFGTGDIRGVIAPESANNAKHGGGFVPTIALGIPGSSIMALYIAAFMIHGINPGTEMLTKHMDMIYTVVWSIALANVLASGVCLLLSNQLAKIALVRIHVLFPLVVVVVFLAAFMSTTQLGDLFALFSVSALGWIMKHARWPRPPLLLAFVLAPVLERQLFLSLQLFGASWLLRPSVIVIFLLTVASVGYGLRQEQRLRHAA